MISVNNLNKEYQNCSGKTLVSYLKKLRKEQRKMIKILEKLHQGTSIERKRKIWEFCVLLDISKVGFGLKQDASSSHENESFEPQNLRKLSK